MRCEVAYSLNSLTHEAGERCGADATVRYTFGGAPVNVCDYHARQINRNLPHGKELVTITSTKLEDAGAGETVKPDEDAGPEAREGAGFARKA